MDGSFLRPFRPREPMLGQRRALVNLPARIGSRTCSLWYIPGRDRSPRAEGPMNSNPPRIACLAGAAALLAVSSLPGLPRPDGSHHGRRARGPHPLPLERPAGRPGRGDAGHRAGRPISRGLFPQDGPRARVRDELPPDVPAEGLAARPAGVARDRGPGRLARAGALGRVRPPDRAGGLPARGDGRARLLRLPRPGARNGSGTTSRGWTSRARSCSSRSTSRETARAASSTART